MSDPRTPVTDYQAIVERLRKMEQRLDRLATPGGSQLARTVALLSGLRTYSVTGGSATQSGPGLTAYSPLPSVSIELERPSRVLITASMPYNSNIPPNTTGAVQGLVGVSGVLALTVRDEWRSGTFLQIARNAFGQSIIEDLAAGVHDVALLSGSRLELTGGSPGLDFINGDAVTITATVLGPA